MYIYIYRYIYTHIYTSIYTSIHKQKSPSSSNCQNQTALLSHFIQLNSSILPQLAPLRCPARYSPASPEYRKVYPPLYSRYNGLYLVPIAILHLAIQASRPLLFGTVQGASRHYRADNQAMIQCYSCCLWSSCDVTLLFYCSWCNTINSVIKELFTA